MEKAQILVVEDEGIIAKDIQSMLRTLGYDVPVTVGTGEKAILAARDNRPDLILMDINLRGSIDGVQAAPATISAQQDVPIVYLTANSDAATMQRAKVTDPFGFLVKPFEERALHAGIEMALYKHRSERKTREREQWLSTTLRSIADGVVTTDEKGFVTFVNIVAEHLLGWTHAESVGQHYSVIFSVLEGASRQAPEDAIAMALGQGLTRPGSNHTLLISKEGVQRHIVHSTAPIRHDDGRIAGCVIVFSDVSERERLEAELRQVQKMDAVGKLAGSIAHDFNNALTAMMGYSSLLVARLPKSEPLHDDASQILRAAEHSARLTRQLLVFSRKQTIRPTRMDLGGTVDHVRGLLRRLLPENILLSVSIPTDLWPIEADPGQCEQIVINMAVNARDAMPQGGKLSIDLQNISLPDTGDGAACGECVTLQIADTGTGMGPEVMARIFEPFFTTKPADRGTGLGLSTCERIVKQAGGFIKVSSVIGQGTLFTIYFPRTHGPALDESAPVEDGLLLSSGNRTILVAEDEEAVRMLIARVLEDNGYTVIETGNGREALAEMDRQGQAVDLIITDMIMPELGGREFVASYRAGASNGHGHTPVLFMSGYNDENIGSDPLFESATAFIQKPFTAEVLARTVRQILSETSSPASV